MWFDELSNKESIKYKKIVKESDQFSNGTIKIKIIKNNDFETMLQVDNKNRINVKNIPMNYWCKMLVEIYALVINSQTNTFSLFLRPIILSFKEKQSKMYNYKFLEDSDSDKDEMDVPDSELSSIFIRQKIMNKKNLKSSDLTSSQIFINEENYSKKSSSSTSDDNQEKIKNSDLTSSSEKKSNKLSTQSSDSSDLEEKLTQKSSSSSSSEKKYENKLKEITETSSSNSEENVEKKSDNIILEKFKSDLKFSDKNISSSDSSDKIKLTESSSDEEYLNKMKKDLNSTN